MCAASLLPALAAAAISAGAPEADGASAIENYATTFRTLVEGAADARRIIVGDSVQIHAVGRVRASGPAKPFWSTRDAGSSAYSYTAGTGSVITGWDQGCLGARVGETRELHIPSAEAVRTTVSCFALIMFFSSAAHRLHAASPPIGARLVRRKWFPSVGDQPRRRSHLRN